MGYTTREAAELLGVSQRFIVNLIKRGLLSAHKHGHVWVVDPESVQKYKEAPKNKGGRPKKQEG